MNSLKRQSINTASDFRTLDRRAQPRIPICVSLTVDRGNAELTGCHARNICTAGIAIDVPRDAELRSGEVIGLRLHIWTGSDYMTRFLRAKVLRCKPRHVTALIVDHEQTANVVVQDILYYQQYERRDITRATIKRWSFKDNLNAWVARLMP